MMTINSDVSINLRDAPEYAIQKSNEPPLHLESQDLYNTHLNFDKKEDNLLNLAGGGSGSAIVPRIHKHFNKSMDVNDIQHKESEKLVFNTMKWLHLAACILICISFRMKTIGHHNCKQFLQFVVLVSYFCVGWFLVYVVKKTHKFWDEDFNMVRCWLFIELGYIFIWIASGMIFMTLAQVCKLKSTVHFKDEIKQNDSVWTSRESDDFLRYMKHDFFIVVYLTS
jgi:hypothetical protein